MRISRAFWGFALLTILTMISDRLMFVIFPNYLIDKNFSATEIGLVFSIAYFFILISRTFIGKLSDLVGRKIIMSIGLLTQAISVFFYPVINKLYEFSVVKGVYELSDTLVNSVKDALLADVFKKNVRNKIIRKIGNIFVWSRALAVLIGFLVTTYFYTMFGFYVASFSLFLSFLLPLVLIKEPKIKTRIRPKVSISFRKYPLMFKMITAIGFLFSLSFAVSYYPGFFILARNLGIAENILFLILFSVYSFNGIIIFLTRKWIDRTNKWNLTLISLSFFSVLLLLYPFATSILQFSIIFFGVHLAFSYYWIAFKVVLLDNTVKSFRGEQVGFEKTIEGLGNLIGPTVGGFLIDNISLSSSFFLAGGIGVVGIIFTYFFMARHSSVQKYISSA